VNQPVPILERRFGGLVTKIHRGECVLVLGPRIAIPVDIAGGPRVTIDHYLSARLLEDAGLASTSHVALREAVARCEREKGAAACRSFIQELVSEFDQLTTELHTDLASLPFRLVLMATPDRMMVNALTSAGKTPQEACYNYSQGIAAESPLSLPTSNTPIVYSLFGRHDQAESMVLNDKNLLDYLVRVIKESPPLPDAVRATVRAPSTVFLFVGFGFHNWWLRLLLKVLEMTGVENRAISLALEDDSFDAAVAQEHKAFFESVGIYIQARDDWNSLAKHLAASFQSTAGAASAASASARPGAAAPAPQASGGGPMVFLSYASEDGARVDALRMALERRGVSVWEDKQNLRVGQNWAHQIERIIGSVDYFVFVQTENMDRRDHSGKDGVYNWELKEALARQRKRPFGAVFVLHVTAGACADRPEKELADLHRMSIDTDAGIDHVAEHIRRTHNATRGASAGVS
jgi:TIR domain/SIR2-like domain